MYYFVMCRTKEDQDDRIFFFSFLSKYLLWKEKFWSLLTKQDFLLSSKKFCSELNLQNRNVATCSWFWTSLFIASSWKVRKCKQYALCFKFVHSPGNICTATDTFRDSWEQINMWKKLQTRSFNPEIWQNFTSCVQQKLVSASPCGESLGNNKHIF